MATQQEMFSYNGYVGSAEISPEDECLVGQILYIDDLVMYQGDSYKELEVAFREAVTGYLESCAEVGKQPQKSYSGHFNIRIGKELHSKAARFAIKKGVSLNDVVRTAVDVYVGEGNAQMNTSQMALVPNLNWLTTTGLTYGTPSDPWIFYSPPMGMNTVPDVTVSTTSGSTNHAAAVINIADYQKAA